jgi:hypothetical protein
MVSGYTRKMDVIYSYVLIIKRQNKENSNMKGEVSNLSITWTILQQWYIWSISI